MSDGNEGGRNKRRRAAPFGEPVDDSFRNYMKRKISLQRQQFGLVVAPPPPAPESARTSPAPKISKDGSPRKTLENEQQKRTVRFDEGVDFRERQPNLTSVADVLQNLQRRNSHRRRKKHRIKTQANQPVTRADVGASATDGEPRAPRIESTSSELPAADSILGVLDHLQKKAASRPRPKSILRKRNRAKVNGQSVDAITQREEGPDYQETTHGERGESSAKIAAVSHPVSDTNEVNATINTPVAHRPDLFLTGVVVLVNGHTNPDATTLMRLLHKHGGDLEKYETDRVTHIIADQLSTAKANMYKRQKKPVPVCRPEWITDCVARGKLLAHGKYLLQSVRDSSASTKSMTSFFHANNKSAPTKEQPLALRNEAMVLSESASENRWRDRDPSEASYQVDGQIRTVGNDPNFLDSYFASSRLSYIGSFKQRVNPSQNAAGTRPKLKEGSTRFVMLVDLDCFFAAVALRKFPQYIDHPVAVGHNNIMNSNAGGDNPGMQAKNSSGELSTCNYIARSYGVRKGMFLGDAIRLCPSLVVLPYLFDDYEEVACLVSEILQEYADKYQGVVETVSCDESYVEVHLAPSDYNRADDVYTFVKGMGEKIRDQIESRTNCTASIGIGPNKLLAKLAADKVKPNRCGVVKDGKQFLDGATLRAIPGVGRKMQKKLQAQGLDSVNDVWDLEDEAEDALADIVGRGNAKKIFAFCQGKDDRSVIPAARQSIGAECNYGVRFDGPYGVSHMISKLAAEVNKRMTAVEVRSTKLVLKLMVSKNPSLAPGKFLGHGSCNNLTRSSITPLTRESSVISSSALSLYSQLNIDKDAIRGMGIVMSELKADGDEPTSPTKLTSWLSEAKSCRCESDSAEEELEIERGDEAAGTEELETKATGDLTFSQLDQGVLSSLPKEVLEEVKTMYCRKKSSPKKRHGVIPAGHASLKRMFKLANVKAGQELLRGEATLSQLEELPMEMQLQIANEDAVVIAKTSKSSGGVRRRPTSSPPKTIDSGFTSKTIRPDLYCEPNEQIQTLQAPLQAPGQYYRQNIAPLRNYISSNPNPDHSAVAKVQAFLSVCVDESRLEDLVNFLRLIKRQEAWDSAVYNKLRDTSLAEVKRKTGNALDAQWLGLGHRDYVGRNDDT